MMNPIPIRDLRQHRRDSAGFEYVYPVLSRRAGGISLGVNLNTNNACNWACVYCQVPGLIRGSPAPIDLDRLESELKALVADVVRGDWLQRLAATGTLAAQTGQLVDIAFSGNGEPTLAPEFPLAVARVEKVMREFGLAQSIPLRLITNGSGVHRNTGRSGIARIGAMGGEVWFKVDRATRDGIWETNRVFVDPPIVRTRLVRCSELSATWVQTCWFALDQASPPANEERAYLDFVAGIRERISGVHLYGVARESMQPDGARITRLPAEALETFAERIREIGVRVTVSP